MLALCCTAPAAGPPRSGYLSPSRGSRPFSPFRFPIAAVRKLVQGSQSVGSNNPPKGNLQVPSSPHGRHQSPLLSPKGTRQQAPYRSPTANPRQTTPIGSNNQQKLDPQMPSSSHGRHQSPHLSPKATRQQVPYRLPTANPRQTTTLEEPVRAKAPSLPHVKAPSLPQVVHRYNANASHLMLPSSTLANAIVHMLV